MTSFASWFIPQGYDVPSTSHKVGEQAGRRAGCSSHQVGEQAGRWGGGEEGRQGCGVAGACHSPTSLNLLKEL